MKSATLRLVYLNPREFDYILRQAESRVFGRPMLGKPDDDRTAAQLWVHFDRLSKKWGGEG